MIELAGAGILFLAIGLGLAASRRVPRLGRWIAASAAVLVLSVLLISMLDGSFMASSGRDASLENGCGFARGC